MKTQYFLCAIAIAVCSSVGFSQTNDGPLAKRFDEIAKRNEASRRNREIERRENALTVLKSAYVHAFVDLAKVSIDGKYETGEFTFPANDPKIYASLITYVEVSDNICRSKTEFERSNIEVERKRYITVTTDCFSKKYSNEGNRKQRFQFEGNTDSPSTYRFSKVDN